MEDSSGFTAAIGFAQLTDGENGYDTANLLGIAIGLFPLLIQL
jgi:hypothetical protein